MCRTICSTKAIQQGNILRTFVRSSAIVSLLLIYTVSIIAIVCIAQIIRCIIIEIFVGLLMQLCHWVDTNVVCSCVTNELHTQ